MRIAHGERAADRLRHVVLAANARSEERHHAVADELVDGAAVLVDLLAWTER